MQQTGDQPGKPANKETLEKGDSDKPQNPAGQLSEKPDASLSPGDHAEASKCGGKTDKKGKSEDRTDKEQH